MKGQAKAKQPLVKNELFQKSNKKNQRKKICIHNHNNRDKVSRGNFIRLVLGHHREKPEYITNKHNERYTEFIEK